jgi:glycosyltransferase involved in cell wall biosynthesis
MRIVFFSHYFPPEVNAPANRTHEHCREWVAAGHEVHVVTCVPSHPVGEPFKGYRRSWYVHEMLDGIHVHRVWTHLAPNRGILRRTVNYLSFIPTSVFRAWRLGRFNLAIGTSPQFFCAVATWLFAATRRVPWIFELRDLWPESIPAVGAMQPSAALRALHRLEMRMYRSAAGVVCVTKAFIENLARRGIDRGKLYFVPNGIVPAFWQSGDSEAGRRSLGLSDDAIVASFVGTIGMAHGLSTVLDAAARLRVEAPGVQVLIVGEGAELPQLRAIVAERQLTNVRFTGLVPRGDIPSILAATDIALVTLKPSDVFKTVLPSKMFEAMAARRPIVLAVDGEARETLERAEAGLAIAPGSVDALVAAIVRLAGDPGLRRRLGEAGGRFVAQEFSRTVWAERYLRILASIAGSQAGPGAYTRQSAVTSAGSSREVKRA